MSSAKLYEALDVVFKASHRRRHVHRDLGSHVERKGLAVKTRMKELRSASGMTQGNLARRVGVRHETILFLFEDG